MMELIILKRTYFDINTSFDFYQSMSILVFADSHAHGRGADACPFGAASLRSQYGLVRHSYRRGGITLLTRGVRVRIMLATRGVRNC